MDHFLLAVSFTVAGALCVALGHWLGRLAGTQAIGVIDSCRIFAQTVRRQRRSRTTITGHFTLPTGEVVQFRQDYPAAPWLLLKTGEQVRVVYDPSRPETAIVDSWKVPPWRKTVRNLVWAAGFVLFGVGVVGMWSWRFVFDTREAEEDDAKRRATAAPMDDAEFRRRVEQRWQQGEGNASNH